jgi:hypothetical protein
MPQLIASSPGPEPASPFDACIADAAAGGRHLMERMLASTQQALNQRAATASGSLERDALRESQKQLLKYEATLCDLYPAALLEAFSGAVDAADAPAARTASAVLSFDQLELMDESQVQESVELARAQQAALLATEGPLTEFNALISSALGFKTVQPDRNPLRPETYVRVLRNVLLQSGAPSAARLRWMPFLGASLGEELSRVYVTLSHKLRTAGVTAAGYVVTHATPAGPGRAASAGSAAAGSTADSAAAHPEGGRTREEVTLTVAQLRRLLAGELDPEGVRGGAAASSVSGRVRRSDFNHTVPAAFEALQEMKQVDQVMQRLASRSEGGDASGESQRPSALAELREQLRTDARGLGQALGLEVVHLMVDNIVADPRLLAPMQQAVRDMEPALLRLALIDPRFFSDKMHPARRLLEQMTQRSLAWKDVAAPGFAAFMEPLWQVVRALGVVPIESAEPFEFALRSLSDIWNEQGRRERKQRTAAVQSLLLAEQRNLVADRLSREIRAREDTAQAPADLVGFLAGPWAQVMAQARISDSEGQPDPGGFGAIINDLLWSAQPELARNSIPRLTRLIPSLLAKLREGLASIDYPEAETRSFFAELMALHQQALRPPGAAVDPAAAAAHARAQLEARFEARDAAEPWLAPAEARDSGFMDTRDFDGAAAGAPDFEATQPGFVDTQPASGWRSRASAAEPSGDVGNELIPEGAWVEFIVDRRVRRTQLTWTSPHRTLFMFTDAEGGTHSMTRRSVQRLLAEGGLRVVSDQAVVDEALDAVAATAMRNSLDLSL